MAGRHTTRANRVRRVREARGLSQGELATAASLSRQSLGAIESGRASPGVEAALAIARALGESVEALFGAAPPAESLMAEPAEREVRGRLTLAHINGRWVARALSRDDLHTSADAFVRRRRGDGVEVELARETAAARENVVVMGCALGLAVLADRANGTRGPGRFVWLPASSTDALAALARGHTHVAGVHLIDAHDGVANVNDVRRLLPGAALALITFARWEVGLVVAPGNPRRVRSPSDLGRRGLRLVVREKGSGARRLLDRGLDAAGLREAPVLAGALHARGHLQVAQAVALGAADVGIATRDAALAFGLDLIPMAEERFDLVVRAGDLNEPRLRRFFGALATQGFQRELTALGYDTRGTGDQVAELSGRRLPRSSTRARA